MHFENFRSYLKFCLKIQRKTLQYFFFHLENKFSSNIFQNSGTFSILFKYDLKIINREKSCHMSHNIAKSNVFFPINFNVTSRHVAELRYILTHNVMLRNILEH